MSDRISVALPIVKTRFLAKAIESVLAQTFRDFELIIVNNGENPDIRSDITRIVERYRDERIGYFMNEHPLPLTERTRVIHDWNQCLGHARGKFFVMFSDDDVYEREFLEDMTRLTTKYPGTNLFHCRVSLIDEEGRTFFLAPTCPEHESVVDFIWHRLNNYRVQFAPDFMCRTGALREIGGFRDLPLAWGSDDLTWFSIAQRGGVAYTPKVLCHWRRSNINISGSGDLESRLQAVDLYRDWIRGFLEAYAPSDDSEKEILALIGDASVRWSEQEKNFLFFTGVRRHNFIKQLALFMRLRKQHDLSAKIMLKSIWRSLSKEDRNK